MNKPLFYRSKKEKEKEKLVPCFSNQEDKPWDMNISRIHYEGGRVIIHHS